MLEEAPRKSEVEQWLGIVSGEFHYTKALHEQVPKNFYPHLRMIFHRLVEEGKVEPAGGKRDGVYRVVEKLPDPLEFGTEPTDSDIELPFGLREYVVIPKETVTVVAGSKSAGKTGFLYRTAFLNRDRKVIILSNLEGGRNVLRDRFLAMGLSLPFPFKIYHVTDHFHDHVREKDSIYIIDYIDCADGEFYKIGHYVKKVSDKLQGLNSVAVVGLQKPDGRDMPFGKDQTLKASFLTIVLNKNLLKIYDAKKSTNPKVNPNNMQWKFTYDEEGTSFTNIERWYGN